MAGLYRVMRVSYVPEGAQPYEDWKLILCAPNGEVVLEDARLALEKANDDKRVRFVIADYSSVPRKNGWEAYKNLSNFVNCLASSKEQEHFLRGFDIDHPTIQQQLMGLLLSVVYRHADRQYPDARNEDSVQVARKIKNLLGEYGNYFPFV